jgi:hypothetical protein
MAIDELSSQLVGGALRLSNDAFRIVVWSTPDAMASRDMSHVGRPWQ